MPDKPKGDGAFKLTYATMFNPPEELHTRFETALKEQKSELGREYGMLIGGDEVHSSEQFEDRSPINQEWLLGRFQQGGEAEATRALEAARQATHSWSRTPWRERVATMRRVADRIDERVYELAAATALEVGKNRMEAVADVAEAAAMIRYACDQMEANEGFIVQMGQDPLKGFSAQNVSVLRPYGVWVVISPFNFPAALTAGPAGAALLAGNCVVMKPATDTPWTVRLLAECFLAGGLPNGAVNYVTGPGGTLGEALVKSPLLDGITFTGSFSVGIHIHRRFAHGKYPRPSILEMGGKNPSLVSRNADLERAVSGIMRSAFGLQGQKCSANSRVYVEQSVYDQFVSKFIAATQAIKVGDPTDRAVFMGPVINRKAYEDFKEYNEELSEGGRFLIGGHVLTEGELGKGFFCQPTIVSEVEVSHRLWKHEMFLPITMVHAIESLEQGMQLANDVSYGLTAGFYGSEEEAEWFFDHIEAGVTYANRPQGATTGAWPGFQPFGGWKGSGSSGKNAGGVHYLQLYMHEQIHTLVQ